MFWFIAGLILLVVAVIFALVSGMKWIMGVGVALAGLGILLSSVYTQDVGEALIIKNNDGTIAKLDTTAGYGMKAPWQSRISFDIRGQQALFKGNGEPTSKNETVEGPEITVGNKVFSNVDVAVRFSIDPDAVKDIYTEYKSEDVFWTRVISNDIKTTVKDAAVKYEPEQLLSERETVGADIQARLEKRWAKQGIIVDNVNLLTVRPPKAYVERMTEAQNALVKVTQEQANTKVIEEQAKQKVITAQGEADANNVKAKSLTPELVAIEMAKSGTVFVVEPGTGSIINIPAPAAEPKK